MFNPLSTILFFGRNGFKTSNGDYTRAGATTAQGASLVNEAAKHNNSIFGKAAGKIVQACDNLAKSDKAFNYASKVVKFASNNVNTVIGIAGCVKVLNAEDKKTESFIQGGSFLGMLAAEGYMKKNLKGALSTITKGRWLGVLTGLTFVAGSIAASTFGEKLGRKIAAHCNKTSDIKYDLADINNNNVREYKA